MNLHRATELQGSLNGTRILLVEDEVLIAVELKMSLEEAGATVTHAQRQEKAVTLARETAFDAAILDVNLGRNTTCEPVAQILQDRGVPFLLHTGDYRVAGDLVERIGAPVAHKPIASSRIIEMLATMLKPA